MRVLRKVLECDFGLSLPYHKMHDDQALEDNGPCRVAQSVGKGSEDLGDAGFTRVGRYQYVFDILRFRGGELHVGMSREYLRALVKYDAGVNNEREGRAHPYLDLGAALDALLEGACHISLYGSLSRNALAGGAAAGGC
jgi:hypothetical protein